MFLTQNTNQFKQTPFLGQLTRDPQPNTLPVRINPVTTFAYGAVAAPLKAYGVSADGEIMVDFSTGPNDGPIVGVIAYDPQLNTYAAGARCRMAGPGNILFLKAGSAIVSWTNVSTTAATSTSDAQVATDTTGGHYITGQALTGAAAANGLLAVKIAPLSL